MEVKINKEIRDYTEGILLGLSLRQCLFSFFACVMAVIFYSLCIDRLGMEITSWLCMISAAPFVALGFIRYQGMNAEQIVVCVIRSLLIKQHNLIFKPQNLYYEYLKEILKNKNLNSKLLKNIVKYRSHSRIENIKGVLEEKDIQYVCFSDDDLRFCWLFLCGVSLVVLVVLFICFFFVVFF